MRGGMRGEWSSRAVVVRSVNAQQLPALFLGHGAPPLLEDPVWPGQLREWADSLPRPTGILIVSAHWESAPVALSSPAPGTPLIYDFSGFGAHFYRMQYATPDASQLLNLVTGRFAAAERPLVIDRGLDHGAWVPLKVMYPHADIPVLQLSVPSEDPEMLMALGARLRSLRDQGVLIIGSGFLTHGLPFLRPQDWQGTAPPPGWSRDFDDWAAEALARGDVSELAAFRSRAPGMPYAHPTAEHFLPLFVALGAATDPESPPTTEIDGFFLGLSKRSVALA